jgi:hypothetical protein
MIAWVSPERTGEVDAGEDLLVLDADLQARGSRASS